MREACIHAAAAAVAALINATPRTPSVPDLADAIARTVAAEAAAPPSPLTLALRRRRRALQAAIAEALGCEGTPAGEAAGARARRLAQEFDGLAAEVWRQPAIGWDGVLSRAEVALAYHQDAVDGAIEGLHAPCPFERALAELLAAVEGMMRGVPAAGPSARAARQPCTPSTATVEDSSGQGATAAAVAAFPCREHADDCDGGRDAARIGSRPDRAGHGGGPEPGRRDTAW